MRRHTWILAAGLLALAVVAAGWWRQAAVGGHAQGPSAKDAPKGDKKQDSPAMAAVRKTADEFTRAFNKGDAKAVAVFCTKECEYVGPGGESITGRDALEKSYAEFFKKYPKAKIAVEIETVRLLGRNAALEEGLLRLSLPDEKEPRATRYSVLHVHEEGGWRMASIREWVPDPATLVSLKDIEWLLGEWEAKTEAAEVRVRYEWNEDKAFLRCRYTLKRGGKVASSGTQIIGKDPAGGLRAWLFDSSGTFGQSLWLPDADRWVIEAAGTLPDGSTVTAVNVLVPLGKDAFTWQALERTAAGTPLTGTPPLKVSRVKAEK